jgi:hypothetical protein
MGTMSKKHRQNGHILTSVQESTSLELKRQDLDTHCNPPDALPWSQTVTRVLFKCWLVAASVAAFRLIITYALVSFVLAFFIGFLRLDNSLAEFIKAVFHLVGRFTIVIILVEGAYLAYATGKFKLSTSNFGLNFPRGLRELKSLDRLCAPEELMKKHKPKLLKFLMEAFKGEFTYWTDRLKLFGAIASAVSAFFGVRFIESNPHLAAWALTIGIFSSWIFFVGLRLGKVTQRGLRHFSRQLLLAELESASDNANGNRKG